MSIFSFLIHKWWQISSFWGKVEFRVGSWGWIWLFFLFCLYGSPTLRAQGDVGVSSVSSVWACVGRLYGRLHPSVCDIMDWTISYRSKRWWRRTQRPQGPHVSSICPLALWCSPCCFLPRAARKKSSCFYRPFWLRVSRVSLALARAECWLYWGVYYGTLFRMNAASLGTYCSWSVHTSTPVPLKRHGVQGRSGSQASNGQSAGQSEPPGSFQPHHLYHLFLCTVSVAPRLQWTGKRLLEVLSYGGDTFLICNGQFAAEMTPVWSSRRH